MLPFLMTTNGGGGLKVEVRMQRVIEAAVIAAVLAAIGYIAIIPRLEERIEVVRHDVEEVKNMIGNNNRLIVDHLQSGGHTSLERRVNRLENNQDRIRDNQSKGE